METNEVLRQRNRKRRAALDADQLEAAADALKTRITELDAYRHARRIAAYFAVNGEIGLAPLIDHALSEGKQIYLPNLDQLALQFAPYFQGQKMRVNKFRLPEPDVDDDQMRSPRELDLVLAPLVVFDKQGNRIGMGGGFYDRSFAFRKQPGNDLPRLIGVAHEFQRIEKIIAESWDVPLDMVVTEQRVYERSEYSEPLLR